MPFQIMNGAPTFPFHRPVCCRFLPERLTFFFLNFVECVPHDNQGLIKQTFPNYKLVIDSAYNGLNCIEVIKNEISLGEPPYNLVFMDIDMPVMDGFEATQQIKRLQKENPDYRLAKIIFCSAYESDEQKKYCTTIGGDYYVTKPISISKIKQIFDKFV